METYSEHSHAASAATPSGAVAQDKSAPEQPERPAALPVNFDTIPEELKGLNQFTCWRYEWRGGRWTKVPFMATGAKKAWNKDEARKAAWNEKQAEKAAKEGRKWKTKDRSTASSTDPETWSSFEDAKRTYERSLSNPKWQYDGIGIALDGEVDENGLTLAAIDIDKVSDDPKRPARANEIIKAVRSYTEVSPSAKGFRIFLRAKPCA